MFKKLFLWENKERGIFRFALFNNRSLMKKLAVVALGGNALLRDNQLGTIDEQEHRAWIKDG